MMKYDLLRPLRRDSQVIRIFPTIIIHQSKNSIINLNIEKNISHKIISNSRFSIYPPGVETGFETECQKSDFESLQDECIGKGTFGSVWKVQHKFTKQIFAIKVINKENIIQQNMIEQLNKEIEIMYKLNHPNIIKLYSHFEDEKDFCLIMEYACKGQLFSIIRKHKKLNPITAKQYMKEIISAVKYLHNLNPPIIHRDIKPENILLDEEGRCKLADFGWASYYNGRKNKETFCGTPQYLAPEMVNEEGHDKSVDIWALGILLFEMLTGRTPFNLIGDQNDLYNSIINSKIIWTDDLPSSAKDLISKILCVEPGERLNLDEILEHPWFKETPPLRPYLQCNDLRKTIELYFEDYFSF